MENIVNLHGYKAGAALINELKISVTEEQINNIFKKHNISDLKEKAGFLNDCMGIDEQVNATKANITEKDEFDYSLALFLEGSWRLLI
ncbi:MAG: hypothetical protein FWD87_01790 [Spirochaetaceae bacterium]|nr:hypothetical protein [Spirochaetaceae bacterium]